MTNKKFLKKILFFIILFLLVYSNNDDNYLNQNKVLIFTGDSNLIGDIYDIDADEDLIARDKNCNLTEFPEQAIRCGNRTNMVCLDMKYLHHCSCLDGFITYPRNNTEYCNLQQKKQVIAFILEFCVGFGAGHFYRHDYTMAYVKLAAFLCGLIFICSFPITAKAVSKCNCECIAVFLSMFYYLYLCTLAVWYIIDLVKFSKNRYKDLTYIDEIGQEINLKPW